ncbi:hypothetical protein [Burkholderia pseudomallei]|uniref:hypothetical protein n=1 Tax=Burkholderia pseudomallei TaxID=28450 RepID=UPI001292D1AA|nr:hypothetical protein [Burkholderia pseudomallei]MBM5616174.1 hypothetical protein [Burkholderia pseudomallei]MBM5633808.1 hypothetical protein [Burkholderia pseudomallei]MBM5661797.1 hypothetical protein [Burkholderia pseudomallei]
MNPCLCCGSIRHNGKNTMLGNGETAAGYAFRTNRGAILQALFSAAQGRFLRFVIEHTFAARMARRRSNRGGGQRGGGCDRPGPAQPGTSTSTSTSISTCTCTSSSSSSSSIGNNDNDNIIGGGISHGDEPRVMGSG